MEAIPSDVVVDGGGGANSEEQEDIRESYQLQFLPKVVLEIVIQKLDDPKDVWSLLETFPLIGQVVDVSKSCKLLFDEVFPMLFKDIDKADILNCRQVCKWWKKSIDNFVEDPPMQNPYDSTTFPEVEASIRSADLKSKKMDAVIIRHPDGFHEKVRYVKEKRELGQPIPSFVGKSIKFLPTEHENPFNEIFGHMDDYNGFEAPLKDYYNDLEDFLAEVGSEVWHASIPLTGRQFYRNTYVDHYEGFQRCLQLLPSLKSLSPGMPVHLIAAFSSEAEISEAKDKLANYMSAFPLPDMPNLEALTLLSIPRLEPLEELLVALLKKFSKQIRRLIVNFEILMREDSDLNFESLFELKLIGCTECTETFKKWITDLKTPRLERLILTSGFSPPEIDLRQVFEACEVLPVKALKIVGNPVFHDPTFFSSPTDILPILRNVTAFVLHHDCVLRKDLFSCLKFLPMLEYLEIKKHKISIWFEEDPNEVENWDGEEAGENENEVEEEDVEDGVQDGDEEKTEDGEDKSEEISENELRDPDGLQVGPNGEKIVVWELLPKLKMFVVGEKRFPREIYYKI